MITSLTYMTGDDFLSCVSTGGPASEVTWSRDGLEIAAMNNSLYDFSQHISDTETGSYINTLTSAGGSLVGRFSCRVNNTRGTDGMESEFFSHLLSIPGRLSLAYCSFVER